MWCTGTSDADTKEAATMLHRKLTRLTNQAKDITISSPIAAWPPWFKGQYRYIMLAKINYRYYKKYTKLLVQNLPVGWKVDPNPNTLLSF